METLDIVSGLLARREAPVKGRFEFRVVRCRSVVVTALHDYAPSLPWFAYKWTQAIAHRVVMWMFARSLRRNPEASALAPGEV